MFMSLGAIAARFKDAGMKDLYIYRDKLLLKVPLIRS